MASSILSVLWPDEFTIYDVRVCGELNDFQNVGNLTRFDKLWPRYDAYRAAVRATAPKGLSLRNADRFLWGRSAASQLRKDIARRFRND